MEAAREGVKFVGGSYLMAFEFSQAAFNSNACGGHEIWLTEHTWRRRCSPSQGHWY